MEAQADSPGTWLRHRAGYPLSFISLGVATRCNGLHRLKPALHWHCLGLYRPRGVALLAARIFFASGVTLLPPSRAHRRFKRELCETTMDRHASSGYCGFRTIRPVFLRRFRRASRPWSGVRRPLHFIPSSTLPGVSSITSPPCLVRVRAFVIRCSREFRGVHHIVSPYHTCFPRRLGTGANRFGGS